MKYWAWNDYYQTMYMTVNFHTDLFWNTVPKYLVYYPEAINLNLLYLVHKGK